MGDIVKLQNDTVAETEPDGGSVILPRRRQPCTAMRVDTSSSSGPAIQPGPPPNGGPMAWLHVLLAHLVFFNTWGFANSFGVFQQYYTATLGYQPSDTSWIGGVQVFLLFAVGVFAGRAADAGYFRATFGVGVALQLLGIFTTSACTQYWQIFLAQGLALGLGNGFTFTPALSVLSTYFSSRRALAVGLSATGSATGGLIYPIMVDKLLQSPYLGFQWTLRIVGFVMFAAYIPCLLFFKPRIPYRKSGPLIEWRAFKEIQYTLIAISMFFGFWGMYFAFFYLGVFARDDLRASYTTSINLLMTTNGAGVLGRIIPSLIAVRLGVLNTVIPFIFCASLLVYSWQAIYSTPGLYIFAVFYGIVAGALQSLLPTLAASLTDDLTRSGTRLGMIMTIVSFATLTGPPIAGALIQEQGGQYQGAEIFAATTILAGGLFAVMARVAKAGWGLKTKV